MFDLTTELQDGKPALARSVSILFGAILILLSAITTAAFFATYASAVFVFLSPALSPYLAAAAGVICFEGASVVWSWLRANDSDTGQQLAIANVGAWGAMFGGLIITAVFLALNSNLIAGQLDATAIESLSILGGLLIVIGIAGNFALGFTYRNAAASHVAAGNAAQLRALQTAARHRANIATAEATLNNTLAAIQAGLPQHSKQQAADNAARYLAANFNQAAQSNPPDPRRLMEALDLLLEGEETAEAAATSATINENNLWPFAGE